MTQSPAGWYPEPDPAYADQPGRLRYWDGSTWTEHVHQPAAPSAPPAPAYTPQGYQPQTGYYDPAAGYPAHPVYAEPAGMTPDGHPLAGWWQRVLASVLDALIAIPVVIVAALPAVLSEWDNLSQWFDDLDYAAQNGTADPPDPALFDPSQGAFWFLVGSIMVASLAYQFLFLAWKQATPGKLIVGLRVRLRERPELPAGTIALRLFSVFLLGLCWIPQLLDYLWPLWDDKNQALHDKMAKTNVVKKAR